MPDLQDALRAYGERLTEVVDEGAATGIPAGSRGSRRVVLAAACVAVLGAVAALVAWRDEAVEVRPPAGEQNPAEPTDEVLNATWTALPTGLGNGDSEPALLVTDEGLINLHPENGGNDVAGEVWTLGSDETTVFAPSGFVWRAFPSVAWTGTEVIMAGGSNGPGVSPLAAAYDPATDEWRELPSPPGTTSGQSANGVTDGVWTGTELISWNSRLAFDPSSESWRTIQPSPLSERSWAAVAATDQGVFVWGGCSPLPASQCDDVLGGDELTDGALYDPETDTWRRIAASPLGPGDHPTAVWTGEEVIVNVPAPVDPEAPNVAAYDPSSDTWRVLPDSPHPAGMYTQAAWTGRFLVLHGGNTSEGTPSGATTVFDLEHERWYRLPDGPARGPHTSVAIGPTSVVIAGGYNDASPWLLEFDPDPSTDPVRVWAQPPSDGPGGFQAGIVGTITYDPNNDCLMIGTTGGTRYPVVWPAGTTATPDGSVLLPDGQQVGIGDELRGSGGIVEPPAEYDIPAECLPLSGEVAMFNANGDIRVVRGPVRIEGIQIDVPSGWSTDASTDESGDVLRLEGEGGAELHIVVRPVPSTASGEGLTTLSAFGDPSAVVDEVEGGYALYAELDCQVEPCKRLEVFGYNLSLDEFTELVSRL